MKRILILLILLFQVCPIDTNKSSACNNISKLSLDDNSQDCALSSLYEKADFPVGVAINFQKLLHEKRYANLIISQFSSITPERSMKASVIHPGIDVYDFAETDYLMNFCKKNKKRLHGHTLLWYRDNPKWMEKYKGSKNDWENLLKDHIQTIVSHCKDQVKSWDVINEAFNGDGSLRENIWLKNIGESYIEKSFIYAAEADPNALLFYNDFDLESKPEKLDAILKFLGKLKAKGVKIDGIGMQMHVSINSPYMSEINIAAMRIQTSGYMVHYSEFDITIARSGKLWSMNKHLLNVQGTRIKDIVAGYRKLNSNNRFGITMWGLSDEDSWLYEKNDRDKPLLFDTRYKIKPAYCGFLDGLNEN
ncbi:MAG: endo,4-beta-xylanase [Bacteroidetes bacterium]|jgi:endo-1,4-beta-xylanase|nr:endo,4-beta-xylanase [Bacteroidota bacterium]